MTLSDDIFTEILSRLPVKSLLRFRCVSKSWLKLISSSNFVNLHLKTSIQNNSKIIFPTYQDTYTIDYQTPCYDPKPYDFPLNDQSLIGSCNGIICLSDKEYYMALWNPATKEYVDVPYASVEERLEDEERDVVVGFGYDPVLDQYKIVRSVFFFRDSEHTEFYLCEVKVCTLGTGEWRTIGHPPCCLRSRHMAPLVNGALHWLGGLPIGSNSLNHKIICFDIHSEEFGVVPWIEGIVEGDVTLGVLQGCLSVLISCGDDRGIGVWMMKDYGVKESWTKLFSLQLPAAVTAFGSIEPLVLRENGEMLLKSEGEVYAYDGVDHTLAATYCICDIPYSCYDGHMFAESLVSIKSLVCMETDDEDSP